MENKRQVGGGSSLDHLFGPKNTSSSSSSSSSGIFASIFSPPSAVPAVRDHGITGNYQLGGGKCGNPDNGPKDGKGGREKSNVYQSERAEPSYLSNSIYYGGQENYSTRTATDQESQHMFKKDGGDDDGNGNDSTGASRGNWWQGSLYY